MLRQGLSGLSTWQRFEIRRIEDLGNAIFGARLDVLQMTGPPIRGSLAFAAGNGIVLSSGLIEGRVALSGFLPSDAVTLGIALHVGPGSRLWLNAARDGDVAIFLPDDRYDAYYTEGTLYVAATLSRERLEEIARQAGLAHDPQMTAKAGLHDRPLAPPVLAWLRHQIAGIHRGDAVTEAAGGEIGPRLLEAVIAHFATGPGGNGGMEPAGRARIVARARRFILENLAAPLTLSAVARAAETSQRTLNRAFVEVFDDTPVDYVNRLRLHRIRRDLASEAGTPQTVAKVAARWGIHEPGRMSGRYHTLFGEYPHETLALAQRAQRHGPVFY
ncbi:helix-turn-helix domain-containing protein [Ensifer sp. MJa1]|uniref:helix-turn-helix domain-containing protein n=1 Tax=Ensifer sp. MJa1 TaxID=2919888 RepID=UPI0030093209